MYLRSEHFGSLGPNLGIFNSIQLIFFYIHTYIFLFNSNKHVLFLVCSLRVQSLCSTFQNYCCFAISGADPGFFLGGGTLVSCPTSTPINHIYIFFWQNTSCIRKPQVISGGGGGAHPLHPSPRSAPEYVVQVLLLARCISCTC